MTTGVVALYRQGYSAGEIARILKVDKQVVIKLLRAAELRGEV